MNATESDWKSKLTDDGYNGIKKKGTEPPFNCVNSVSLNFKEEKI